MPFGKRSSRYCDVRRDNTRSTGPASSSQASGPTSRARAERSLTPLSYPCVDVTTRGRAVQIATRHLLAVLLFCCAVTRTALAQDVITVVGVITTRADSA